MRPTYSDSFRERLNLMYPECRVSQELLSYDATNELLDFVTVRGENLSYMPAGRRQEINDDGRWRREGRQEGRPARVARKLLAQPALDRLTDKDFEVFNNRFRAVDMHGTAQFRLVSGTDIRHYYHHANSSSQGGSLNSSCMQHNHCQGFFGIYEENSGRCQLLVLVDSEEKTLGRALVWHTDQGITVMDRVYGNDVTIEMFQREAVIRGWHRRSYNTYDYERWWIDPEGNELVLDLSVTLAVTEFDYYPYVDTFKFLDRAKFQLSNSISSGYDVCLDSTDGYVGDRHYCENCSDLIDDDNVWWARGDAYCEYCYDDLFFSCVACGDPGSSAEGIDVGHGTLCDGCGGVCDGCDEGFYRDGLAYSPEGELFCEACLARHYVLCARCGVYQLKEKALELEGQVCCTLCAVLAEVEGEVHEPAIA